MNNLTVGWAYKTPAILLLVAAFFGGIYATVKGISGIGAMTPIVIGIILALYAIGEYYHHKRGFY